MEQTLDARLLEAGLGDGEDVSLAATIRPHEVAVSDTIAVIASTGSSPRDLPRLSVDLRSSPGDGLASSPPVRSDLEILGVLGEGGMGRVLLARQHSLSRDVAVKTVKDSADERACDSLLVEGAVTGQLEHPAIVPVHALGLDEAGKPALVMKRIEGVSWSELCADAAHPGWSGWEGDSSDRLPGHLQILIAICNAAHFAHSRGIVHRDIKPENVLIGRFGDVYLADWGIAGRVGETRSRLCGTPVYMAPEMVSGSAIDARTDVYLLGATLHAILMGSPRHEGESVMVVLSAAAVSEPFVYPGRVPRELAELVNRACHRDPNERPESARELRDALARYLRHRDSVALGEEALARFSQLRSILAKEELDDDDRRAVDRLSAEARFGLEQALTQWSDNVHAHAALGELEAILDARRARTAELEREARERDPYVDAVPRAIALTLLTGVAIVVSAVALMRAETPGPWLVVAYPAIVLVVVVAGVVIMRRRALATALGRQMTGMLVGALAIVLIGRVLGLFVPIEPAEHFARDSFTIAGVLFVAALAYFRWIGWISLLYLVAGVVITLEPSLGLPVFGSSTALSVAMGAVFTWAMRRRPVG